MAHLLLLTNTLAPSAEVVPAFGLLSHHVRILPAEASALVDAPSADVVIVDARRELAMANSLVEALSDPWQPEQYRDEYRDAVMELIEAKAAGRTLTVPAAATDRDNVVDLATALEASVEAAKAARGRHPTARPKPATDAAPVRKRTTRRSA